MISSLKQLKVLLNLPEMRLFWYFLPLAFALFGISFFYLPFAWFLATCGVLILLALIIFMNNLRLAKLNLEMKVERNELNSIISGLFDGIIAYDSDFKIVIFNKSAEQIFNIAADRIIGRYLSPEKAKEPELFFLGQVLFPSLAPMVIRRSEAGVYPQIMDFSFTQPKAELRVVTEKIIDPNGALLGFVKIIRDRTREIGIVQSKSEFIEVAAHQLRTPLTSINWVFESFMSEQLNEEQKKLVDMGKTAVSNVLKTVNDLLDVSQMEEGKYGYKFENINLNSFIEEVLSNMLILSKEYNVKIYFKKPKEDITIFADYQKLSIALSNLVANAVKYNVANGEVLVEMKKMEDKPYIQISVKDTGIGISPEDIKKLFTKFFRSDNVQKAIADGTGLGLYITKNIIKRHGGEIWAESQLNRGSIFYFTLPTDPKLIPSKEFAGGEE
ncbi:MAG: ATP-binding protein [Patescibacteria group bacterium]|nr:ATP-binding protein [Patescibacteria group bacterium]